MRAESTIDVAFVFGPFTLIPSRQRLLRDSQPIKLGGRALDILHLLLMKAGEEVGAETLIAFAWPNVFVDKSNLKVTINSLRRALNDTFPQTSYIATVVGRGYQFVGQVQIEVVQNEVFPHFDQPVASSLPALPDLIGRQRDIEGVARALDFSRLLTLVGPGGVGKTGLAIAVAHARHDDFPDGVHFVDLSGTDNPVIVPHLVAKCLGIRGDPADLVAALEKHLRNKRILVVLDNCEHLLHATASVAAQLIASTKNCCVLATSREPLGVIGENLQRIDALALPRGALDGQASRALTYPAIELFAKRAFETADYQLIDRDVHDVAELCKALDGLPLAIEIAAAKLTQFTPAELLASHNQHLREFSRDDPASHARHRTLWATLDWSYQLLSVQEAAMFRVLCVFAGSFEWPDVVGMARLLEFEPYHTTLALGGLVSKSLLAVEVDGDQLRYRLLETVRSYAQDRLTHDPLARDAYRLHAQLVLALFAKSQSEWAWSDTQEWRARYEARTTDLSRALDWCFSDEGDASLGVELATSAILLWNEQTSIAEQRFQIGRALHFHASMTDAPQRTAELAMSRAWSLVFGRQLLAEADEAWDTAVEFARRTGAQDQVLLAMFGQAIFLVITGRIEQSASLLHDAIKIAQIWDPSSLIDAERLLVSAEMRLGNLVEARTKLERLAQDLAHGSPSLTMTRFQLQRYVGIHSDLATLTWLTGEPERALRMTEEILLRMEQMSQLLSQFHILTLVAMPLAHWSGDFGALERYSTALRGSLDRENLTLIEPVHRFYTAVARHAQGDSDALDEMRLALDEMVRDRYLAGGPKYFCVLADAFVESGRLEDADAAIEFAFTLQDKTKERWCLPELRRVKARVMLATGERDQAAAMLVAARGDAAALGARSIELRIANDMAQIAIAEGNQAKAVDLVAPIYGLFADKTATQDLKRSFCLLANAGTGPRS